ncbi:hypothetical protein L9F63_025187, partial [Diploptera punctata]
TYNSTKIHQWNYRSLKKYKTVYYNRKHPLMIVLVIGQCFHVLTSSSLTPFNISIHNYIRSILISTTNYVFECRLNALPQLRAKQIKLTKCSFRSLRSFMFS